MNPDKRKFLLFEILRAPPSGEDWGLLINGGFEDYVGTQDDNTMDSFPGWTIPATDGYVDATATVYSGSSAIRMYKQFFGQDVEIYQDASPTPAVGTWLELKVWTRGDGSLNSDVTTWAEGDVDSFLMPYMDSGIIGTVYGSVVYGLYIASINNYVRIHLYCYGEESSTYIDNVSLVEVENLVLNGHLNDWTDDDPDDWTVGGEVGSNPEVSEVGQGELHGGTGTGHCNLYSTATAAQPSISQSVLESGKDYRITFWKSTMTGTLRVYAGTNYEDYSVVGQHTVTMFLTANGTDLRFVGQSSACNITINNILVVEV